MSGIATQTYEMVRKAKSVREDIEIATTRKMIGFNKSLTIKSILIGGSQQLPFSVQKCKILA